MKTRRRNITSEDFKVPDYFNPKPGERQARGQRMATRTFKHRKGKPPRIVRAVRGKLTGRTKGAFGGGKV